MLQQIFSHTPLYVWAILGFLVYRGVLASRAREVTLRKLCIIPLVMLALSLSGVHGSFGFDGVAPLAWAIGALAGAALAWTLTDARKIVAIPERISVQRPGFTGRKLRWNSKVSRRSARAASLNCAGLKAACADHKASNSCATIKRST